MRLRGYLDALSAGVVLQAVPALIGAFVAAPVLAREMETGTFRYANTYPTAIALATAGLVDLEAIITGSYSLEETEQALRAGLDDPHSVKAIVHP